MLWLQEKFDRDCLHILPKNFIYLLEYHHISITSLT